MADLTTSYLGLTLKNPVIIGSSGLSSTPEGVKKLAENGAGAIVLKSLFEEQIMVEANMTVAANEYDYPESADYIKNYSSAKSVDTYLNLVEQSKKSVSVPVIASINCVTDKEWIGFAKKVEDAGADALELNVSLLPSDVNATSEVNERMYFSILEKIHSKINIPVALKLGNQSAGFANLLRKIDWTGNVKGVVLFNKHYSPDIDINSLKMTTAPVFSQPDAYAETLRWVALMSGKLKCDIAATTGIFESKTAIKMLLGGARAVQIASVVYKKGPEYIADIVNGIENWMNNNNYKSIEDFRGKMNMENVQHPAVYERVQFMKYFSGIE